MNLKHTVGGTFSYLLGVQLIKKQIDYTKKDVAHLSDDLKQARGIFKQKPPRIDTWNAMQQTHRISDESLINQYKMRRVVSFILLLALLISLYSVIVSNDLISGLAATLISVLLYFKNTLRLFQIRQRNLCTINDYLKAIKLSLKEILPLALPLNWKLKSYQSEEGAYDIR